MPVFIGAFVAYEFFAVTPGLTTVESIFASCSPLLRNFFVHLVSCIMPLEGNNLTLPKLSGNYNT